MSLQSLLLFWAFLAAAYAGLQTFRQRQDALLPVLIAREAQFARLRTRPGAPPRAEVGLSLAITNVGTGPALSCRCEAWLERLGESVANHSPVKDLDDDGVELLKEQTKSHFFLEFAGLGVGMSETNIWQPTQTYDGPLDGDFWVHWQLQYRDTFNRKGEAWGSAFFESEVRESQAPVGSAF